jgi:hypothetical protein
MAAVTRSQVGMDASTAQFAPQISGLIAGEDILVGAPCYIKAADGKIYNSNGVAVAEAAKVDGFSPRNAKAGQALTLYGKGTRFRLATGLTPGANLYLGAVAGGYDTAATTGGLLPMARCINDTDIRITADAL